MTVSRYRLTALGKLGAALFVAPTPVAALYVTPSAKSQGQIAYERAITETGGAIEAFTPSPIILMILVTATMIGLVFLLIGREIVTED